MSRKGFPTSTKAVPIVIALIVGTFLASSFPLTSRGEVAGLRDQLEKGLKARLPADFAFINTVIFMVETQQLPLDLVRSTFLWVRKNRSHKRYMMIYFERVLRLRAAERGIVIP